MVYAQKNTSVLVKVVDIYLAVLWLGKYPQLFTQLFWVIVNILNSGTSTYLLIYLGTLEYKWILGSCQKPFGKGLAAIDLPHIQQRGGVGVLSTFTPYTLCWLHAIQTGTSCNEIKQLWAYRLMYILQVTWTYQVWWLYVLKNVYFTRTHIMFSI